MSRFTDRDMRDALALIQVASSADGEQQFAESVVSGLAQLIPADGCGYNERELVSHRLLVSIESESAHVDVSDAVSEFCAEYPLSMLRHRAETRALKLSDFVSGRELHRLAYYNHALLPLEIEHQMRLWLWSPPGIARYFFVNRGKRDGDFSDHDRDILSLLRPFLIALHERFDAPVADREHADGLTEREVEILGWVARGKTNGEIAMLLVVSPHTVRTHLANVYEKLRVHTRTAAVARAFASN
jgi:DNA-binding CsgD family transcriptional regulator